MQQYPTATNSVAELRHFEAASGKKFNAAAAYRSNVKNILF
jgi:hypothetical protein